MDYILLNADGSIKKVNFTDFIQQNNDGVNKIFVSCEGLNYSAHSALAVFVLPDGSISEEIGVYQENVEYTAHKFANGYLVTLTQNETKLAGLVFLTINIKNVSANTNLYSYRATLTINKTADQADLTYITLAQYEALKDYIDIGDRPINIYYSNNTVYMKNAVGDVGVTPEYLEENYVPYTGATKNINLGSHAVSGSGFGAVSSSGVSALEQPGIHRTVQDDGEYYLTFPTQTQQSETFATQEWVNAHYIRYRPALIGLLDDYNEKELTLFSYRITIVGTTPESQWDADLYFPNDSGTFALTKQLPKQGLCATFSTSDFTRQSGGNYAASDIEVEDFISGSNLLVITWDNCFAICPIPQSGAGRVCAALWNANGESQIVRIRYELKSNNTLLDISLSSSFTPPSGHTAYVFCYKLFN